ncbi:MAG: hypothetical protein IJX74_01785 [Clostridia bacterium]|nr:hypothetical protein [Clostridia bacterium]
MKKLDVLHGCIISVIVVVVLILILVAIPFVQLFALIFPGNDIEEKNYISLDYNIVWEECESKMIGACGVPRRRYYKINGVSTDEFVACVVTGTGIGPAVGPTVKKHVDFEGKLTFDLSSAKLFLSDGYPSGDDWCLYREKTEKQVLTEIPEPLAKEIAKTIENAEANYLTYKDLRDGVSSPTPILNDEHEYLMLRFSFKEYEEIYWEANIYVCDGKYYIRIKNDAIGEEDVWYIPCTLGLTVMIDDICDEYGLDEPTYP